MGRANAPLVAVLRSTRAHGVVDAEAHAALDAAVACADTQVSDALEAIRPSVAYAVWVGSGGSCSPRHRMPMNSRD